MLYCDKSSMNFETVLTMMDIQCSRPTWSLGEFPKVRHSPGRETESDIDLNKLIVGSSGKKGRRQCDPHLAFVNTCQFNKRFSAKTRIHDNRIRSKK